MEERDRPSEDEVIRQDHPAAEDGVEGDEEPQAKRNIRECRVGRRQRRGRQDLSIFVRFVFEEERGASAQFPCASPHIRDAGVGDGHGCEDVERDLGAQLGDDDVEHLFTHILGDKKEGDGAIEQILLCFIEHSIR